MKRDHSDAIIAVLFVIIIGLILRYQYVSNRDCSQKGGVYFYREGKCLKGFEIVE